MSESVHEISPKVTMNYLKSEIFYGWFKNRAIPGPLLWADAYEKIKMIENIEEDDDMLNDEGTIDYLSRLSGMDYGAFKKLWDRLTNEQKREVLDSVIDELAFFGIRSLFHRIAFELTYYGIFTGKKFNMKDVAKVVEAAKDYLNKRIDYHELMETIANVLWPSEEDKKSTAYEDFWRGADLADYVGDNTLNKIIKEYLVEKVGNRYSLLS